MHFSQDDEWQRIIEIRLILIYNLIYKLINDAPNLVMNNFTPQHFSMGSPILPMLGVEQYVVTAQRSRKPCGALLWQFIIGEHRAA